MRLKTRIFSVLIGFLLLGSLPVGAQQADLVGGPGVHFRFPFSLRSPSVPALEPGGRWGPSMFPAVYASEWADDMYALFAASRLATAHARLLTSLGQFGITRGRDRRRFTIAAPPVRGARGRRTPLGVVSDVAELGIQMRSRIEMRFDRLKNERCTAFEFGTIFSGCEAGFPAPSLEQQFRVSAGGIVSQRVNLNIDFDTEREFDTNDDIRLWYQGLEDEILRRIEVGNVRFQTPASRFISSGVGGNSFGLLAEAELGPLNVRAILAQQKGSSVKSRTFTIGDEVTQPVSREVRDLDWEAGRFFAVIDPADLPGFPVVDLLELSGAGFPAEIRITEVRVYRLRALSGQGAGNSETGAIDAVAVRDDSDQRVGPFRWELLLEGRDYYVDPSLVWFGLANRVGSRDFLAVSYINILGDTVGTFPSVGGGIDTLRLIHEPESGTEVPTFFHELRNFYRVGGTDVDRATIDVRVVVNESDRPLNGQGTYLSRLGMARVNDEGTLDNANRVFPRLRDPNQGLPIRDLFLVYPHLTPFADSLALAEQERNDSLYSTPTYLRDTQGPPSIFNMLFSFDSRGGGNRSNLSLGALGIQPGSERISVGNRQLRRGIDYEISYDLGEVTFLNPDSLFPGPSQVRIDFEEVQQFDSDAKSLLGFAATYNLGSVGSINAVGLMQNERTQLLRPQLGFEPQASFVGGISTSLDFRLDNLTRVLDRLPFLETQVPSRITINGELAMSRPNPNRGGVAFVEDFEGSGGASFSILLNEHRFQLGSRPSTGDGLAPQYLNAGVFADIDAVPLLWQNLIQIGFEALSFASSDIDATIVTIGSAREIETVLWMTLKPDTVGGAGDPVTGEPRWIRDHTPGPRWRSITQPLGGLGLGIDMSRSEFLEFWVLENAERTARANGAVLIFDLGTNFEDAVAPAPTSFRVVAGDTVFSGLQFLGTGVLDTERDTITNTFNAAVDDVGIHEDLLPVITNTTTNEQVTDLVLCETPSSAGVPVFPRGDLGVGCSRNNGLLDTEDLDGDNRLDILVGRSREDLFRYVFPIGSEQHFVRTGGSIDDSQGRPLVWRLYRIPLRADSIQVGSPNIRQIQSIRLTMVVPDRGPQEEELFIALARMRFVGAPWIKRAASPIAGIYGLSPEPHGEVIASIVTTENATDLGYTSPPGVFDAATRAGAGLEFGSQQINEKSLRLLARDLRLGERAEAFERFTDNSNKSFLKYNVLRVWARGRGAGWEEGDLEFFIKAGRDEDNFYLYQTGANVTTWEPEVVVDLNRWLALRTEVETRWLRGEQPSGAAECGGSPTAFVACDGPYLVHVENPGISPPNLARVSEVAVGMIRVAENVVIMEAELWVDDIRLDQVVDDPGYAAAFDARFVFADVADVTWSLTRRDDQFRQLGQEPSYTGNQVSTVGTSLRVDKFLPRSWGLNIPVTANFTSTSADPFFLNRSDVRAAGIENLRTTESQSRFYQISIRRERRGTSFLARNLLDPVSVFAQFQSSESSRLLATAESNSRQASFRYNRAPDARTVPAAPGFVRRFVASLPGFIRNSGFGRGLMRARLRWNPVHYNLTSTLVDNRSLRRNFRVPVALEDDSTNQGFQSVVKTWVNQASVNFRPFNTLNFTVSQASTRDLQDYGDSTAIGRLLAREGRTFVGRNVGFERTNTFTTQFNVQPVIAAWIHPSITLNSNFNFNRNPNIKKPVRVDGDSLGAFRLPENISNSRRQQFLALIDLPALASGLFGDSSFVASLVRGVNVVNLSYILQRNSTFNRFPTDVRGRYRFGLGGLDEFLRQGGVLATSAVETKQWTASAGGQLPLRARVDVNYSEGNTRTFSLRGEVHSEVVENIRDWPVVNVSWAHSPGSFIRRLVTNIALSSIYRKTETNTLLPVIGAAGPTDIGPVNRMTNRTSFSQSLTLSWSPGITTSGRFSHSLSSSFASGSLTRSVQDSWSGTLSFNFRPPRSLVRLNSPLITRLDFSSFAFSVCLLRAGQDECATVADNSRKQFGITMNTGFSQTVRAGASFDYSVTEEQTNSSKFSQITFSVFAQINFLAGQLR